MRKHNTRERVGFRKLKPSTAIVNHSPLFRHLEGATEGTILFRFMNADGVVLQNPSIFIEEIIGSGAKVQLSVIDTEEIEHATIVNLEEGDNDFSAVTIPSRHRLIVKLIEGEVRGVWVSATAARR